jgi:hypothetical protein
MKRMNMRRFLSDDPLIRTTQAAYEAIHSLHVEVHNLELPEWRQAATGRAIT